MRSTNAVVPAVLCAVLLFGVSGCRNRETLPGGSRPSGKILLIVVDTLRADALGCYGYERPTSPNIDRLAESGALFLQARAQSPWTLPSVATILTGLYPRQHGAVRVGRDFYPLASAARTLAEILRDEGFTTGAFVNTQFGYAPFQIGQGFDTYSVEKGARNSGIRDASATAALAASWIDEHANEDFLLLVHFFDPHLKYEAPEEYRRRFVRDPSYNGEYTEAWGDEEELDAVLEGDIRPGRADRNHLRDLYDAEVAYTDAAVGVILHQLGDSGIRNETLVVFTADHGEEFWEHGGFEHGHAFYDEVIRVPLIISRPGRLPAGATAEASVGHIDVFPTVLEAVGATVPGNLPGRSLLRPDDSALDERILISEAPLWGAALGSLVWNRDKVFLFADRKPLLTAPWQDPRESRNLAKEKPELTRLFREEAARIESGLEDASPPRTPEERVPVDLESDQFEALRKQGYLR